LNLDYSDIHNIISLTSYERNTLICFAVYNYLNYHRWFEDRFVFQSKLWIFPLLARDALTNHCPPPILVFFSHTILLLFITNLLILILPQIRKQVQVGWNGRCRERYLFPGFVESNQLQNGCQMATVCKTFLSKYL